MQIEKERNRIIHVLYISMLLFFLYFFFHTIFYQILPFILGFMIAFSLRPLVRRSEQYLHIPQKLTACILLLTLYGTIGFGFCVLCIKGFAFLQNFILDFPDLYRLQIEPAIYSSIVRFQSIVQDFDPKYGMFFQDVMLYLTTTLRSLTNTISAQLITLFAHFANGVPSFLIAFFLTLLSSFFFSLDFTNIARFLIRQCPEQKRYFIYALREHIVDTVLQYGIAYGKLMSITFIELALGLQYLQVENALVIAFIIACFDILPVLGTGSIMLPWILIAFFNHQSKFAIGLLILHLTINLLRQVMEPKIIGKQLGIHPLLLLASVYLGVKLFGFLGIFIAPMFLQVVVSLNKDGLIHLYKP